tara:strand:+ start:78 stop:308 length:231 start_codon:yes stop_codon:yes gene_type:complete
MNHKYLYSFNEFLYYGGEKHSAEETGFETESQAVKYATEEVSAAHGGETFWTARFDRTRIPHMLDEKKRHTRILKE